jgi:hypothetical protein
LLVVPPVMLETLGPLGMGVLVGQRVMVDLVVSPEPKEMHLVSQVSVIAIRAPRFLHLVV